MNVIPFSSDRLVRTAFDLAAEPALGPALRAPSVGFVLHVRGERLWCSPSAFPAAIASGLFVGASFKEVRLADPAQAARLFVLADGEQRRGAASAVFRGAGMFVAERLAGPAESGWTCVVFRRLAPTPWSRDDLAAAFDLTPREGDVTLALLDGMPVEAIATRLALRASTVRQYLKTIFVKTRTTSQAQLIARLNGGEWDAAAADPAER